MILALADALGRAREEERRADDRLTKPEGAELGPREKERLTGLRRRSDAFGMSLDAYERNPHVDPERREEVLRVLREAAKEVSEQFRRYRAAFGIPDPAENVQKPA